MIRILWSCKPINLDHHALQDRTWLGKVASTLEHFWFLYIFFILFYVSFKAFVSETYSRFSPDTNLILIVSHGAF